MAEPDKLWGDLAPAGPCYICGDPRDHDGLPHGEITRAQIDLIRAKIELEVISELLSRSVTPAYFESRIRTLTRRVETLEQESHG